MKLRSRINEMFTPEFLDELYDLFRQHKFYVKGKDGKEERVQDVRHFKALTFRKKLFDYFEEKEVSFSFLGDGTNRMAFLVDGYVFKLALDDQGYIDNLTDAKEIKIFKAFGINHDQAEMIVKSNIENSQVLENQFNYYDSFWFKLSDEELSATQDENLINKRMNYVSLYLYWR